MLLRWLDDGTASATSVVEFSFSNQRQFLRRVGNRACFQNTNARVQPCYFARHFLDMCGHFPAFSAPGNQLGRRGKALLQFTHLNFQLSDLIRARDIRHGGWRNSHCNRCGIGYRRGSRRALFDLIFQRGFFQTPGVSCSDCNTAISDCASCNFRFKSTPSGNASFPGLDTCQLLFEKFVLSPAMPLWSASGEAPNVLKRACNASLSMASVAFALLQLSHLAIGFLQLLAGLFRAQPDWSGRRCSSSLRSG